MDAPGHRGIMANRSGANQGPIDCDGRMRQNVRVRWLTATLILLAACPAPRRYAVEQAGMPCERATRFAYEVMQQIGYTVTEAVEATRSTSGRVTGTQRRADGSLDRGTVRITCTSGGVEFQPVEGDLVPSFEFSRKFGYSATTLAKQPVEQPTVQSGRMEVSMELIDVPRATLDLGGWPLVGEDVLVRVRVRNGTDRAVVVQPGSIALLDKGGEPVNALENGARSASLGAGAPAESVRMRLLERTRVPPGTQIERFLVFPPGAYPEAQVAVEDVETGESDGFQVPVR
jgi:hypothetical protein